MTETPEDRQARLRADREEYARNLRDKPYDGMSFGAAFNAAKAEGRSDFPWRGSTYSTKTSQEQAREIAAKASGSGRGAAAGRTAADRDTAPMRGEPTAPVSRPRASLSNIPGLIARGMSEGADRVPAGRGAGAAFVGAALPRLLVPAAKTLRDHPSVTPERRQMLKEMEDYINVLNQADRPARNPAMRALEERVEPPFKKGGKVKAYAKGGSVKGSGCEQRGLRKCKVY